MSSKTTFRSALSHWYTWPVLLGIIEILVVATDALARAGGGHNYTGGTATGESFSGGGGGGEIPLWLIYILLRHPETGIPILIFVGIGWVVYKRMSADGTTASAIRRLAGPMPSDTSALDRIRSADPSFDESRFLEWAKRAESLVQQAWSSGSMEPVRNYVSDGLFRTFATQLAIMRHQGVKNVIAEHRVLSAKIQAASHTRRFDTIHVLFKAVNREGDFPVTMPDEQARQAAARAKETTYSEIWSFVRKPGSHTRDDAGFASQTCPNCGAPLEQTQAGKCAYCDALVNSGDYDWVLAEITQASEWKGASSGESIPGLDAIAAEDEDMGRQVAEDRATYVFWRWIEAQVSSDAGPLSKCAVPGIARAAADAAKQNHYKTAVGAVDLIHCEALDPQQPGSKDRLYFKILWSSAPSATAAPVHREIALVLSRSERPTKKTGLSHARCPNCLGPLEENDATTCAYCGHALGAGKGDFVLEEVCHPYDLIARLRTAVLDGPRSATDNVDDIPDWAIPDLSSSKMRMHLLFAMAAMVKADGKVTAKEKRLLKKAAKRWHIPYVMVMPILGGNETLESMGVEIGDPRVFVEGLIGAALIDGRIDKSERALLFSVARSAGLPDAWVEERIQARTAAR